MTLSKSIPFRLRRTWRAMFAGNGLSFVVLVPLLMIAASVTGLPHSDFVDGLSVLAFAAFLTTASAATALRESDRRLVLAKGDYCLDLAELALLPPGTRFYYADLEEDCVDTEAFTLIRAWPDQEFWRVRCVDMEGREKVMILSDEDAGIWLTIDT